MNHLERINYLVEKVRSQKAGDAEYAELQELLRNDPDNLRAGHIAALLDDGAAEPLRPYQRREWEHIADAVLQADKGFDKGKKTVTIRFPYWWAAAAALVLIAAGTFFWQRSAVPETGMAARTETVNDAAPGTSKATLTLADGTVVPLDSNMDRVLRQGAAAIRQQGGLLSYDVQGETSVVSYNTLKTPRGGQFQVRLPDGTQVWLNAASSLRYPTAFQGEERLVEITGEAYFEVVKNAGMPFRVKVNGRAAIEVLGTDFNVNAYEDEAAIHTTLLKGSVRVSSGGHTAMLRPGQQAQIGKAISVKDDADLEKVMAWKNGVFNFHNAGLKEMMRQLSRWYDIEVVYSGQIPEREFWGKMGRNLTLSQVLKGLEGTGVKFEIKDNGKKLVVLP